MRRRCILAILAVAVLSLGSCGGTSLTSRLKDRDITIDGKLSDWNGALEFVKKAGLSFAVMNDDTHVYIVVAATDQLVRQQIMISGLYLWFDEKGEKEKNFGVCFPIGGLEDRSVEMRPQGPRGGEPGRRPMRLGDPDSLPSPPLGSRRPPSSPGADSLRARGPWSPPDSLAGPDSSGGRPPMPGRGPRGGPRPPSGTGPMAPREMMVYSVKSDTWDQGKGSLGGVDVAADFGRKALVLEFRIPLERDPSTGYGIGVGPGQTIGVGVEAPAIRGGAEGDSGPPQGENRGPEGGPPGRSGGSRGNGPPGGKGGGAGGMGGGSGGRGGSGGGMGGPGGGMNGPGDEMGGPGGGGEEQQKRPEAIRIWGKLSLAGKRTA